MIKEFFLVFNVESNLITDLKASISNQESISSRKIYFGCNNWTCKISNFLLSQPENQTLRSLRKNSLSSLIWVKIG
jgi:hypothetical protein